MPSLLPPFVRQRLDRQPHPLFTLWHTCSPHHQEQPLCSHNAAGSPPPPRCTPPRLHHAHSSHARQRTDFRPRPPHIARLSTAADPPHTPASAPYTHSYSSRHLLSRHAPPSSIQTTASESKSETAWLAYGPREATPARRNAAADASRYEPA